jgi:hypothetical protein
MHNDIPPIVFRTTPGKRGHWPYVAFLVMGALYWLGAAWVAFDLRIPLHSRVSRSMGIGERLFYGCAASTAALVLLRGAARCGAIDKISY